MPIITNNASTLGAQCRSRWVAKGVQLSDVSGFSPRFLPGIDMFSFTVILPLGTAIWKLLVRLCVYRMKYSVHSAGELFLSPFSL